MIDIYKNNKILFVDDEQNILDAMKRKLSKEFNIFIANSGKQGLDIIKKNGPLSVVISDMEMPGMNGVEFLEQVKIIDKNIMTIILSGKADMNSIIEAINKGNIYKMLTKPVDNKLLKEILSESISKFQKIVDLERESIIDGLTNLYNHKHIFSLLRNEIKRIRRYGTNLSILMLDIDFFKKVNDSYGHQTGDMVLEKIALKIKGCIREADFAGRYGGEEFLIILTETSVKKGKIVAERIRAEIENLKWDIDELKITISGGFIEFNKESAEELVEKADQLLYKAKQNGRNQIQI